MDPVRGSVVLAPKAQGAGCGPAAAGVAAPRGRPRSLGWGTCCSSARPRPHCVSRLGEEGRCPGFQARAPWHRGAGQAPAYTEPGGRAEAGRTLLRGWGWGWGCVRGGGTGRGGGAAQDRPRLNCPGGLCPVWKTGDGGTALAAEALESRVLRLTCKASRQPRHAPPAEPGLSDLTAFVPGARGGV